MAVASGLPWADELAWAKLQRNRNLESGRLPALYPVSGGCSPQLQHRRSPRNRLRRKTCLSSYNSLPGSVRLVSSQTHGSLLRCILFEFPRTLALHHRCLLLL
jgi:hypothetical protein